MSKLAKLLNALLIGFDIAGHAAAGVFLTNTRIVGIRESRAKPFVLLAHLAAWPLIGIIQAVRTGGFDGFAASLLRPFSLSGAWRLLFTFIGGRWLAQEVYRRLHPRPHPPELLSTHVQDADLTGHILRTEGWDGGLKGVLHRANQLYHLEVTTHELRLPRLPQEFDGFTLVHLSDIHYMKSISSEFVRRYVQMAVEMAPDLVGMTGDYQTYPKDVETIASLLSPLGKWSGKERGGQGAVAVLGNHDREAGTPHVIDALRKAGITVLQNENLRLERGGASLYVAGVADPWSWRADLDLALQDIPPGSCTILLAHVPDLFVQAAEAEVDLQLSGHNHGGQIKLPILGPVLVSSRYGRRYAEGLHKRNRSLMYVSRGLGGKPPVRWGAKPEIAKLILRAGA